MAYQQGFKGVKTMKRSYTDVAVSLLLAGMLAVTGCGGTEKKPVEKPAEKAAAKPASGLTVYTSVYNGMVQEMAKPVVEQQLKDVKVNWQTAGSESVKAKLLDEMKSGQAEADLVMISDPDFYLQLKKGGKLLNYKSPESAELAEPVDADGVPVRIGDVMEFAYDPPQDQPIFEVSGFGAKGALFYVPRGEIRARKATTASIVRHAKQRTLEDALEELEGLRGYRNSTYEDVVTRAAELADKIRELLEVGE